MSDPEPIYTYRAGEKVLLEKEPDQFVVRALPDELADLGIRGAERVSSASSRVRATAADLEPLLARAREVAPAHHAYHVAETGEEFLITDRVFVTFRQAMSAEALDAFAGEYGLELLETYSDREYLFRLTDHTGMNPIKLVVRLTEDEPLVEVAENDLNYRASTYQLPLPTDPEYVRQWHLHTRFSNPLFDPRAASRCEDAWQLLGGFGSPDVVIGVTDDGCKLDHDDFDSDRKFAGWGYFTGSRLVRDVDIDASPARMYQSGADHGTSCAGVIAAEVDAALTVGGAPGCRLFPIKWESDGPFLLISDSKLLTVLDYLGDKVDVLSNSWGKVPTNLRASIVVNRIQALAQTGGRRGRGIVFLWAAGNENCPIEHQAVVDVPYDSGWQDRADGSSVWAGVSTARRFRNNLVGVPGVMHVAALASFARRSHYSNYGTGITICAPTSSTHKYRRLQAARGIPVTTATGPGDDVTRTFGGTSSATPLVAAIAGLVISANPALTALEVISILKRTAAKDLHFGGYPQTPPASFDLNTSWDVSPIAPFDSGAFQTIGDADGTWSPWFGHGRVDAREAVAAALGNRPAPDGRLRFESRPGRVIPDADAAGITDVIAVPNAGRVQDIRVSVDIRHTWIGDLVVDLTAPNGASVVLHQRSGSSQDNLQTTFDVSSVPALATLREAGLLGDWALRVRDLARQDEGSLQSWGLDIALVSDPLAREDVAAVRIPDDSVAGITRTLELPAGQVIREIAVSVDITHPFIGDLRVTLTPPGGTAVSMHDRVGGSDDNLIRTWRSQDLAPLAALRGRDTGGTWRLQVADVARRDEGKLNRWKLEVTV